MLFLVCELTSRSSRTTPTQQGSDDEELVEDDGYGEVGEADPGVSFHVASKKHASAELDRSAFPPVAVRYQQHFSLSGYVPGDAWQFWYPVGDTEISRIFTGPDAINEGWARWSQQ